MMRLSSARTRRGVGAAGSDVFTVDEADATEAVGLGLREKFDGDEGLTSSSQDSIDVSNQWIM
jgi:hypothetical protein